MKLPPRLVKGQRLRLAPDGPLFVVVRTTIGSAYVSEVYKAPRKVELKDGTVFYAKQSGDLLAISPHSFVYPE